MAAPVDKQMWENAKVGAQLAKTFVFDPNDPTKRVDWGGDNESTEPGSKPYPQPKAPLPKVPEDYYKAYGAYAPRYQSSGKKVSKKRSKKVRK